ncbi:MAG: hypothetical protein Q8P52_00010 [bacterium]|nr:hypothetical protein [bacterium]
METQTKFINRYGNRIVLPIKRKQQRKASERIEKYILPAKTEKKERVSERVQQTLYDA